MLRKFAKAGVAAGIHKLGVDRFVGASRRIRDQPLVLSYHRVVENYERSARHSISPMLVGTETFEAQLDWIGRYYDFVELDDLARALETGKTFRKPIASVTFDDGYGDSYYHAFPILKRKGIPMTVFVVTDLVGSTQLQFHDALYLWLATALTQWKQPARQLAEQARQVGIEAPVTDRLCAQLSNPFALTRACLELVPHAQLAQFLDLLKAGVEVPTGILDEFHSLSWEMVTHMAARGVTMGSHTKSHKLLAKESWHTILDELKGSRAELERRLGRKVRHFAYPDGRFNADALNGVAVAGYRYAYTTCTHQDRQQPLLTIPRRVLWENTCVDGFGRFSPSVLSCQLNGIFDPAAKCRQSHWAKTG